MKNTLLQFLVLLLLFTGFTGYGSNINTANLSYECLGNEQYRITLELFVECVDGDNSIGSQDVLPFFYESKKLGVTQKSIILNKIASQSNSWQPLRCQNNFYTTSCSSSGTERGVYKYVYSGILNLGEYKPTNDWLLYFQKNSRATLNDLKITTLNMTFYTSTILNTTTCNNSVKMSSMPILKACINKTEELDLNLSDSNGDELRFRFETPKSTTTNNLAYKTGYTANRPISMNTDLSVKNGKLVISATKLNEIGITTLVIEEWKNGQKIAETFKDIQIETFDCSNTAPSLSDFPNKTTHIQVCVGDTLNVGLTKDDAENNTSFFVKQAPFSNVFNTNTGKFSWTPTLSQVGTHTFEIGVRDDACPYFEEVIKTFTIEVTPSPVFDLGTHSILNCNTGINYNPTIVGNAPYTYQWTSRSPHHQINSTESNLFINSLDTVKVDTFDLVVTDKFGCVNRDSVSLAHPIQAKFKPIKRCFKDFSTFDNQSKTIDNTTITSYEWNFQNTKSGIPNSNDKSPVVLFPNTGVYKTTLTVKNSSGCTDVYDYDVQICNHPTNVAYQRLDSCSLERFDGQGGVPFQDITNYANTPCGRDSLYFRVFNMNSIDTLNPFNSFKYGPESFGVKVNFATEGFYKLEMRTVTEAKCIDTFATKFIIHPRPTISLRQEDINLNCDKPDTTLVAILNPQEKGTGDLIYEWKKDGLLIPSNQQFFIQDSSWTTVNTTGLYTVNVIDSLKCSYQKPINIVYPLIADFRYSQVCESTDAMTFTEKATSFFKLVEWKWNLGDGTEKVITNATTYKHKYTNPDDYSVTLSLKDSTGCTASVSHVVYNTFPVDSFSVNPILAKGICENGKLLAKGNYPDPITGSHIDTIYWNWNGKQYIYSNTFDPTLGHLPLNQGYNILNQTVPINIDSLKVFYKVEYNKHPEMDIFTSCVRQPKGLSYRINEEIDGSFRVSGSCTNDTLSLKFNPISSAKITSWKWTVKERFTENTLFTSTLFNPKQYITKGLANKNYDIYFETTDENGCFKNYNNLPVKATTIKDVDSPILSFDKDSICLGNSVQISAIEPQKKDDLANTYYFFNTTTNDTLINGFGKFAGSDDGIPFLGGNEKQVYTPPFLHEGINAVSFYLGYVNPIDTTSCGAYSYDTIVVYPSPKLAFTYSSVCAKEIVSLTNNSSISFDEITGYNWTLPDGTTTSDKNPKFTFDQGGANNISLEVTTKFGCLNKNGNKLDTTVYFYHTPIADFTIDSDVLEAYIDLPFESTSSVDGIGEEIDIWTFDLGDGTFTTSKSFTHSYPEIAIYPVTHKVISNKGCEAEITKKVNLNTYLNVATVFSPNKDGKNDDFGLIHKEIKELLEYKIYNRWGELVFDGGNDPNARWDGTFRGKDQEVGVYILYVKARGSYNQEYNFKENITLIR